ncbi:MAG: DUF992 domain-containing protein [Pseudorhodoplanes sp.]|nr:hypothetical protein [Pseudorhodoplanes sp.]MBW7947785.1 DUF992 domain-containing protein [Pseudorhodoplanes sp.]MCL4710027.1 DUF992 domain-containing protein [Pseudorhodoplanes sp.]MCQ3942964.1 DUF992 domain-containing protein [Alphaproteobacteria bacterium]GIK79498.1 MAG: hypothetical protein BroJett024_06030 [Alphaproteobacteria bacterium]
MIRIATVAAALAALSFAMPQPVAAQARVKVGTLACNMSGGLGMIVASRKELRCTFSPSARGWRREAYAGAITRVGIDLGATRGGRLVWAVYAPTNAGRAALAGHYGGASAEATVGIGAGANALVGGSRRTVMLQPLSVQGQTGVSLAAGVAGLSLRPAR